MYLFTHTFAAGSSNWDLDGLNELEHQLSWYGAATSGTLQVLVQASDGTWVPVADCKVTLGETDGDGETRQMFRFACAGSDIRIAAGSLDDTLTVELRA